MTFKKPDKVFFNDNFIDYISDVRRGLRCMSSQVNQLRFVKSRMCLSGLGRINSTEYCFAGEDSEESTRSTVHVEKRPCAAHERMVPVEELRSLQIEE